MVSPVRASNLRSSQGLQIYIGYVPEYIERDGAKLYRAAGFNVSVEGYWPVIFPDSHTRFVLVNRYFSEGQEVGQKVWDVCMETTESYEGLTAAIGFIDGHIDILTLGDDGTITVCWPQIAFESGGVWQDDPWQWPGCHDFNFGWKMPVAQGERPVLGDSWVR